MSALPFLPRLGRRRRAVPVDAAAGTDVDRFATLLARPRCWSRPGITSRCPAPLTALADMAAGVDALFATHCEEFRNAMELGDSMMCATTFTVRHVAALAGAGRRRNWVGRCCRSCQPGHGDHPRGAADAREPCCDPDHLPAELYPLLIPQAVDRAIHSPARRHGKLNLLSCNCTRRQMMSLMGGSLFAVLMLPTVAPRWIPYPPQPQCVPASLRLDRGSAGALRWAVLPWHRGDPFTSSACCFTRPGQRQALAQRHRAASDIGAPMARGIRVAGQSSAPARTRWCATSRLSPWPTCTN
ncbi:MAG: hypothetical protein R2851_19570 [Caldilineaceae bacterium]